MAQRVTRSAKKVLKGPSRARGRVSASGSSTDSDRTMRAKGVRKRRGTFSYLEEVVEEELLCSICMDAFTSPVEHSACGNVFCAECVEGATITACPLCRGDCRGGFVPVKNRVLLNMLAKVKVRCDDCGSEMAREEHASHRITEECLASLAPPTGGEDKKERQEGKKAVQCVAYELGCTVRMRREHQEEHAACCPLVAAGETIRALEAEIAALKEEIPLTKRSRDGVRVVARPQKPVLSAKDGPTKLERRAMAEESSSFSSFCMSSSD